MKNKINIKKLFKLGVIRLIEPSLNLMKSYAQKSSESLMSSKYLLEKGQYNDSIALSYFSMYNSLLSLLYFCGIKSENHGASIFLLKEIYEIGNEEILSAKIERKDKQYYPSFSTNSEEVKNSIKTTEEFNSRLRDFIAKLNNSDIKRYRNKFLEIVK